MYGATTRASILVEVPFSSKLMGFQSGNFFNIEFRLSLRWKHEKKSQIVCGTLLTNYFLKIWKITMGTLYIKKENYFWNQFNFQSCNYKVFMKIHHILRVFLYVLNIQEKHVDKWFFLYQKFFSLIKCSPNHFKFFVNFNIFHKKGSTCSKNSKNRIHMFF
jgi:hypothetical protein